MPYVCTLKKKISRENFIEGTRKKMELRGCEIPEGMRRSGIKIF